MNVTARTDRRASPTEDTGYWFLRTPRRFIAAKPELQQHQCPGLHLQAPDRPQGIAQQVDPEPGTAPPRPLRGHQPGSGQRGQHRRPLQQRQNRPTHLRASKHCKLKRPCGSTQSSRRNQPASSASTAKSAGAYLYEFSVWIVSPRVQAKQCLPICTC